MLHDLRNVVGADVNVGPSNNNQRSRRRTLHETAGRFKNGDARAFGADQSPGHIKAVLGEQVVKVVSRNSARNIRKLTAHLITAALGDRLQAGVDFGAASTFANVAIEIFCASRAYV